MKQWASYVETHEVSYNMSKFSSQIQSLKSYAYLAFIWISTSPTINININF